MAYVSSNYVTKAVALAQQNLAKVFPESFGRAGITVAPAPGPHVLRLAVYIVDLTVAAPDVAQDMSSTFSVDAGTATFAIEARDRRVDSCSAGRWMHRRPATMAPTGGHTAAMSPISRRCSKPGRKSAQKASMSSAPCHPSIRTGCKGSNRSFTVRVSAAGTVAPPSRTVPAAGSSDQAGTGPLLTQRKPM